MWTSSASFTWNDEPPPTLGVREPRLPRPSTDSHGAALEQPRDYLQEARELAAHPRVVITAPPVA